MYICICKAITDKQLEEAQRTSKNFREVCKKLGLGSECGSCVQEAIQYSSKQNQSKDTSIKKS